MSDWNDLAAVWIVGAIALAIAIMVLEDIEAPPWWRKR